MLGQVYLGGLFALLGGLGRSWVALGACLAGLGPSWACFVELVRCSWPWACFVELVRCSRSWVRFVELMRRFPFSAAQVSSPWRPYGPTLWQDSYCAPFEVISREHLFFLSFFSSILVNFGAETGLET